MRQRISWALMGVIGIVLIVIGVEGSLGKILGCIFTPGSIVVGSGGGKSGGSPKQPIPPDNNGNCPPGYHLMVPAKGGGGIKSCVPN